jgi:hypothetical protein
VLSYMQYELRGSLKNLVNEQVPGDMLYEQSKFDDDFDDK